MEDELVVAAMQVCDNAYAPYSEFAVGAACLAEDGRVFTGTNVENVSYGLTICAERTAIACAVSSGVRSIKTVAVWNTSGKVALPCGACLQVMAEFGRDVKIIAAAGEERRVYMLDQLLLRPFGGKHE